MEREKLESLIIDFIDGNLDAEDRRQLEAELDRNPDARKLYVELRTVIDGIAGTAPQEPPARIREQFDRMLQEETARTSAKRRILLQPAVYRVAAAVALLITAGFLISRYYQQSRQLAEMAREMEETRRLLAQTKDLMMGMLGNELSASQRMKGVQVALEIREADNEIVEALFQTLLTDRSTNVRLAALDALGRFRDDPKVKKELIRSLAIQTDPMVQIALIRLMVQMKEKSVVDDLQKMVNDTELIQAVKDEAYSGIMKLS